VIHVPAFSGGKDSTALLLWLRERGVPFTAVFCDVGWEHPFTYAYVEEINRTLLGGKLVTVRNERWFAPGSEEPGGLRQLVAKRGRVPSAKARFCTEELKVYPMRDWLRALGDEATVYQGIRAEESPSRAKLPEREWSATYDAWVERPLFRWSAADVFALLERHGVPANPLYSLGAKRVGCFPCIMTRHAELLRLHRTLPEVWDRIAELEAAAGRSFFPPDYIPERFHTARDPKSGLTYPTVADVRRYLLGAGEEQLAMFGETPACMSVYNLCE
jgi:3'-phosphoadenosine 5'-phosphosulfate sulfotransferase (PAPS reductase)/FAD synthetase